VEGSDHGLIYDTLPVVLWKNWKKERKFLVSLVGLYTESRLKLETDTSKI
jgi:hypothetical protein